MCAETAISSPPWHRHKRLQRARIRRRLRLGASVSAKALSLLAEHHGTGPNHRQQILSRMGRGGKQQWDDWPASPSSRWLWRGARKKQDSWSDRKGDGKGKAKNGVTAEFPAYDRKRANVRATEQPDGPSGGEDPTGGETSSVHAPGGAQQHPQSGAAGSLPDQCHRAEDRTLGGVRARSAGGLSQGAPTFPEGYGEAPRRHAEGCGHASRHAGGPAPCLPVRTPTSGGDRRSRQGLRQDNGGRPSRGERPRRSGRSSKSLRRAWRRCAHGGRDCGSPSGYCHCWRCVRGPAWARCPCEHIAPCMCGSRSQLGGFRSKVAQGGTAGDGASGRICGTGAARSISHESQCSLRAWDSALPWAALQRAGWLEAACQDEAAHGTATAGRNQPWKQAGCQAERYGAVRAVIDLACGSNPRPGYRACWCRARALFDRCRDSGTAQHFCRASDSSDHRGRRERGGAARHCCLSGPEGFIELASWRGLGRLGSPSPWGSMGRNPRTSSHLGQGRLCARDIFSFDRAFHFGTNVSSPVQFCLVSQAVSIPRHYLFLCPGSKGRMYLRWDCVGRLPLAKLRAIGYSAVSLDCCCLPLAKPGPLKHTAALWTSGPPCRVVREHLRPFFPQGCNGRVRNNHIGRSGVVTCQPPRKELAFAVSGHLQCCFGNKATPSPCSFGLGPSTIGPLGSRVLALMPEHQPAPCHDYFSTLMS